MHVTSVESSILPAFAAASGNPRDRGLYAAYWRIARNTATACRFRGFTIDCVRAGAHSGSRGACVDGHVRRLHTGHRTTGPSVARSTSGYATRTDNLLVRRTQSTCTDNFNTWPIGVYSLKSGDSTHYRVVDVVFWYAYSSGYSNYYKSVCWNRATSGTIYVDCSTATA